MELLRKGMERFREYQNNKKEKERLNRVNYHPHNIGCTRSKDIEYFDKKYLSSSEGFTYVVMLVDCKSKCLECGRQSCLQELVEIKKNKKE